MITISGFSEATSGSASVRPRIAATLTTACGLTRDTSRNLWETVDRELGR